MLTIEMLSDGPYKLGETIRGKLIWRPDGETKYKGATVKLGWRTEGRGTQQKVDVWQQSIFLVEALSFALLWIHRLQIPRSLAEP